jgi:TonB family protein
MKTTKVPRQPTDPVQAPFVAYVVLSAAVHGVLILGMIGGAWWVWTPTYYKPSAYTVALVDAPLSLQQTSPSAQGQTAPGKPAPVAKQSPPVQEKSAPPPGQPTTVSKPKAAPTLAKPPTAKTPQAMTVLQEKQRQDTPVSKSTKTVQKQQSPPQKKPQTTPPAKRRTSSKARSKPAPPAAATATQTRRVEQVQQRAAEQRLAALRERFGSGVAGNPSAEAVAGLQQVRLRAYQELVREQVIDAWILPIPQEEARQLQATALLTVDRDGHLRQLELLEPSGNPLFDESLLRAIKQAVPLPVLPDDFAGELLEVEMRFRAGDA